MPGAEHRDPGKVVWNETMSVGIDVLDADHVAIIAALQAIIDALDAARSGDEVDQCFAELMGAVSGHFKREELVLRASGYPGAAYHIREHVWLASTLFDIQYNRLHATDNEIRFGVREFLTTWLYGHVLDDDFAYRAHLRAHRAQVDALLAEE